MDTIEERICNVEDRLEEKFQNEGKEIKQWKIAEAFKIWRPYWASLIWDLIWELEDEIENEAGAIVEVLAEKLPV